MVLTIEPTLQPQLVLLTTGLKVAISPVLTRLIIVWKGTCSCIDFNLKPNFATPFIIPFSYCYFFWYPTLTPLSPHLGLAKSQDAILRHCPLEPSLTFCKKKKNKQNFLHFSFPCPTTHHLWGAEVLSDLCSLSKVVLKEGTYVPGGVTQFPRPQVCTMHKMSS